MQTTQVPEPAAAAEVHAVCLIWLFCLKYLLPVGRFWHMRWPCASSSEYLLGLRWKSPSSLLWCPFCPAQLKIPSFARTLQKNPSPLLRHSCWLSRPVCPKTTTSSVHSGPEKADTVVCDILFVQRSSTSRYCCP